MAGRNWVDVWANAMQEEIFGVGWPDAIFDVLLEGTRPAKSSAPRLARIARSSLLLRAVNDSYDFRRSLLSMLRPLDITAMMLALGSTTTKAENRRYMIPWRQLFLDMSWVKVLADRKCTVTIIGNYMRCLYEAIRTLDYAFAATESKLLIVLAETGDGDITWPDIGISISGSIDTSVTWCQAPELDFDTLNTLEIGGAIKTAQVCMVSLKTNESLDLAPSWTPHLATKDTALDDSREIELWHTDLQQLPRTAGWPTRFNPVRLHHPLDAKKISSYLTRISVGDEGDCFALMTCRNGHQS